MDRYTGIDIGEEQICQTLRSLGFGVNYADGNFTVEVPSWRATKDVTIKADIIEEITRIYGYDNFAISTTRSKLHPVKKHRGAHGRKCFERSLGTKNTDCMRCIRIFGATAKNINGWGLR